MRFSASWLPQAAGAGSRNLSPNIKGKTLLLTPSELDSGNDGNHSSEEELEEIYKIEPMVATTSSGAAGPPMPPAVASAEVNFVLIRGS